MAEPARALRHSHRPIERRTADRVAHAPLLRQRPTLTVVHRRSRAARTVSVSAALIVVLMLGATAVQSYVAQGQVELDRLDQQIRQTAEQYEVLRRERAELRSPGRLHDVAAELGMEPAASSEFMTIAPDVLVAVRQSTGALDPTFGDESTLLAQFRSVKALGSETP